MITGRICLIVFGWVAATSAFAQLNIEGVSSDIETTLRAQVSQLESACSASEARAGGVARQTVADASDVLRALGFYQPQISQTLEADENGCWQISLQILAGPVTRIVSLDIRLSGAAEQDGSFQDLLDARPFLEGDQLNHARYEAFKSRFERLAVRRGYYDGRFVTSQIRVDVEQSEAHIILHYDSGVRYRYGQILIDEAGPSQTFVSRYVPFEPGAPVNSAELIELQQRLIDSQYFSSVSVRPQIAQRADGLVDLRVSLEPVKTWRFAVGLGIDTNSGPRASLAVENRLLNPQGDRAAMDMSLSPKLKQFELTHRHPLADPTRELRQWKLGIRSEETDSSRSTRQSVGWSRVRLLDGGWVRTLGASYNRENSEIGTLDIQSQLLLPTLSFQKSSRAGDRRITQGWRINFGLSGAVNQVFSDTSLAQAQLDAKGIMGLGSGRLIGRIAAGATWVERFAEVPASIRYFAGGDNSVRGYDFESLGPRDAEGNVIGARHLLVGSLEYDHPIAENWDLALFVDAGDAFNNAPSFKQGVGFGVRWHTLVGTIRLDLAVPSEGGGLQLHLFMGPEL